MFNAIKSFFEENISNDTTDDLDHQLKLATAALLIEMMEQDHEVRKDERQAVKTALKNKFDLIDEETEELFDLAQAEADEAVDYYQFTSLIAKHYLPEQKKKVVEYLWQVAYADRRLDPLEEHMIRRIADLIYVPHKDFIRAKHKARDS